MNDYEWLVSLSERTRGALNDDEKAALERVKEKIDPEQDQAQYKTEAEKRGEFARWLIDHGKLSEECE